VAVGVLTPRARDEGTAQNPPQQEAAEEPQREQRIAERDLVNGASDFRRVRSGALDRRGERARADAQEEHAADRGEQDRRHGLRDAPDGDAPARAADVLRGDEERRTEADTGDVDERDEVVDPGAPRVDREAERERRETEHDQGEQELPRSGRHLESRHAQRISHGSPRWRLRTQAIASQRSSGSICAAYDGILRKPFVTMWKMWPSFMLSALPKRSDGGAGKPCWTARPLPSAFGPWQTMQ